MRAREAKRKFFDECLTAAFAPLSCPARMGRKAERTLFRTPRASAAAAITSASPDKSLIILFGFGGIGILLVVLVLVILRAGCAGQFG
jgi:hypothetical protein